MRKALKAAWKAAADEQQQQKQQQQQQQRSTPQPQQPFFNPVPGSYYAQYPGYFPQQMNQPPQASAPLTPNTNAQYTNAQYPLQQQIPSPGVPQAYLEQQKIHELQASPGPPAASVYSTPSPPTSGMGVSPGRASAPLPMMQHTHASNPAQPPRSSNSYPEQAPEAVRPSNLHDGNQEPVSSVQSNLEGKLSTLGISSSHPLAPAPPTTSSSRDSRTAAESSPQSIPEACDPPSVRKILSLDGGGVRGLSEVMMLQYLMQQLGVKRGFALEPWQEFDLIVGTSTGGLLAIMLGRLRMSLQECEDAYLQLSQRIFSPARAKGNVIGRGYDFYQANGKFSSAPLEDGIRDLLLNRGFRDDELLFEPDPSKKSCLVVVCAVDQYDTPARIRSYENRNDYDNLLRECKIWEAARATSAASTFFEPITIGRYGQKFVDGALRHNNPIEIADLEAGAMFPGEEKMIVSLGTGVEPPHDVTGNAMKLVETLAHLVTDTEHRNIMFRDSHRAMVDEGRLYRFNVAQGLASVGLEEHKDKDKIAMLTSRYLKNPDTRQAFASCAEVMNKGGQRLQYVGGERLASFRTKQAASHIDACVCQYCNRGIKYNTRAFFCSDCEHPICATCKRQHDVSHASATNAIEVLRWQERMLGTTAAQTCRECLELKRARLCCRDCDFNICLTCLDWFKTSRSEHFKEHRASGHREYLLVLGEFAHVKAQSHRGCSCPWTATAISHCSRCLSICHAGESLYICSDCTIAYSGMEEMCQACYNSEPPQHKTAHKFQTVQFQHTPRSDDGLLRASDFVFTCLECGARVPFLALPDHEHLHLAGFMRPLEVDVLHIAAVNSCPKRKPLRRSRAGPAHPVEGPECDYCLRAFGWAESGVGFCVTCSFCVCPDCWREGVALHRHPLHALVYQKLSPGSGQQAPILNGFCDGCQAPWMGSRFIGIECNACRNVHFCAKCVVQMIEGQKSLRNDGIHGCKTRSWTFYRF